LSGYEASVWYGLVAPSGTPSHIIRQLNELVKTIVFESDTKQKITTSLGGEVVGNSSEQFEALIKSDMQKWGEVIRSSKVKFDD
jgi:tripartite-type tricarboxylate transporter receptor subunit TctC